MTLSVIQSKLVLRAGGFSSITASFDSLPSVGNYVIAVPFGVSTGGAGATVTDNQSNTYTQDAEYANANRVAVFSAPITTSSGTFTVTDNEGVGTSVALLIVEVSDLRTPVFDKTASAQRGIEATKTVGPTATTSQPIELVITAGVQSVSGGGDPPPTLDGAYTNLGSGVGNTFIPQYGAVRAGYKITSGTGAQSADYTFGVSGVCDLIIATYVGPPPPETYQMSSAQ